jgi:orotate phosphoribosyltransferase
MADDILNLVPVRSGHFILESGYHTDVWFDLDSLFVSPRRIAPLVSDISQRLARHEPTAVCGPLLGGAFLAQAVAAELALDFYYTHTLDGSHAKQLFAARYELPAGLRKQARGERFAIVDDVISAGSSVRATHSELTDAGGLVVAVGALVSLGTKAYDYFETLGVAIEALGRREFESWTPDTCPSCLRGERLEDPSSSL